MGSGLGLTAAYSIVKNHGGYLSVKSELGVGTTLFIYLPTTAKESILPKESPFAREVKETLPGRGRIMVMEDENMLRESLCALLSALGYEPALAEDGPETIKIYRQALESGRPFDAVIMDLIIPGGMGGEETIKKLIELDPGVKAIVSSGYSTDPIIVDFKKYGFKYYLIKPYIPQKLGEVLRQVIKGNASEVLSPTIVSP